MIEPPKVLKVLNALYIVASYIRHKTARMEILQFLYLKKDENLLCILGSFCWHISMVTSRVV